MNGIVRALLMIAGIGCIGMASVSAIKGEWLQGCFWMLWEISLTITSISGRVK
jgi:hypothetical protein